MKLRNYKTAEGNPMADNTLRKAVADVRKGIRARLNPSARAIDAKREKWLLTAPVQSLDGKEARLGLVTVGEAIAKRSNAEKARKLSARVSDTNSVKNMDALLAQTKVLLKSWDWKELAVGIALATGRRTIEVLKTGDFRQKRANLIRFRGQAKSKSEKGWFNIPCLVSAKLVVDAVARLRKIENFAGMDNETVNKKAQKPLERVAKKLTSAHTSKPATMHNLRHIYAGYCVQEFMPLGIIFDQFGNAATNQRVFLKAILGHESTAMGLHYESWVIE